MSQGRRQLAIVVLPPGPVDRPPLGPAWLAAYLQTQGFTVGALDWNLREYRNAAEDDRRHWDAIGADSFSGDTTRFFLSSVGRAAEAILAIDAEMLYLPRTEANQDMVREVAREIRRQAPDRLLLVHDETAFLDTERIVCDRLADFIILGEPEETVTEILRRRLNGASWDALRGALPIDSRGAGRFIPREPQRDLDALGFPSFEEFPPADYLSGALPIRSSRGCSYRCLFCGEQPVEGPYRRRSPERVVAEMVQHRTRWGVEEFVCEDLLLDNDPPALLEMSDRLAQSDGSFRWSGQLAPREDLTAETFTRLAAAGCRKLTFGVESFSDELLAAMNKPYTGRAALENIRQAHAAGIETRLNLIVGFPGETDADFLATVRALHELRDCLDGVDRLQPCRLLPGSLLAAQSENWKLTVSSDRDPDQWSHRGYDNLVWRQKRAAELAIWIGGLNLAFAYDRLVPPEHPLRRLEQPIRRRLAEKIALAPEAVLVTLPPWGFENPPVGLAYLSTYLRAHGFRTAVLDFNIRFYRAVPENQRLLWHVENKNFWSDEKTFPVVRHLLQPLLDEAVAELVRLAPPLLGFSVVDPKERITLEVIKAFRRRNRTTRILLGGPACFTPEYRQIFLDEAGDLIDGYCIGEGEATLLEALRRTLAGESWRDVPGLLTLDEKRACRFIPRPPLADLDALPAPTYDEFDHALYPGDSLILEWSRGCIGNCTYCKGRQISGDFRMRGAAHIVAELKRHVEKHGYRRFTIADNLLNGDPEILAEICERLIADGLEIRWNGEAIPLPAMTRDRLAQMARAGCTEIQWGLESASPRVLRLMGKSRFFTVEQAQQVIRDCHEAGIKTCLFIIVGFPGEEEEDFQQTLRFIRENAPWIDQIKSINSMHVITGTAIHVHADQFGLELPARDYHYLWRSRDGRNTPAERNRRIRELLTLCRERQIEVRETNLTEGKQAGPAISPELPLDERAQRLLAEINNLRSFATDGAEAGDRAGPLACGHATPAEAAAEPEPPAPEEFVAANRALAGVLDGARVFAGPEILEIDLTNFCNLDCVGCWNHSPLLGDRRFSGEEKQRRLPLEMVEKLIDDAARLGAKEVQLSGAGDPLCHPDALAIVRRIKERGLACALITNGTLLTERVCRELVAAGLDRLTVSVWAGSPKVYAAVHPNQAPQTLARIKESLQLLHRLKAEARTFAPKVKVYHVVCHLNAADVAAMVTFAVEALAEFIEFTPIDVVPGATDSLALTDEDRELILRQLHDLPKRPDYLELDPTRGGRRPDADGEGLEFARFIKQSLLPKGFRYELDDITRFDVLCPRKEWRLDVREDNLVENALLFFYPREECERCPLHPQCAIDKERYAVKVEFTSFLGYGSFLRRIQSRAASGYDAGKIDEVPCSIGWTYARVKTDGSVIPCCKADALPLGNLRETDFPTVWTNPAYAEFRHRALSTPKSDPYFRAIDCYAACDNLGHNLAVAERLRRFTATEIERLKNARSLLPD